MGFAFLMILAILSTKLASRVGIPGLIVFLGLGMIFGSDGLNLIYFDDPVLAQQISIAALAVILFEGGMSTKRKTLKQVYGPAFSLATIGIIITAVTLGLLSHYVLDLSLYSAILIGAIVSSTDAAAVFALFRNKKMQPKTAATLEIESASNDPMAITLTVLLIDLINGIFPSPVFLISDLAWQIVVGLAMGFIVGKLGPILFNRIKIETSGFYYVLILGICFLSYGLADTIQANGFLAVFITGYFMGNTEFIYKESINRFMEGTSSFSQIALFLMLGLLVNPSEILIYWKEGVIIALILMFIARPVTVFLSTIFWHYALKERIFFCWGGIKGAVPIVLATYPYVSGLKEGHFYFNIVFFVVVISAFIQGTTVDILAHKLGLLKGKKRIPPHTMELISTEKTKKELLEFNVKEKSKLDGVKIEDLPLPPNCLITAIVRNRDIITPRGEREIKSRDLLYILINHDDKDHLLDILESYDENPEKEHHSLNKYSP